MIVLVPKVDGLVLRGVQADDPCAGLKGEELFECQYNSL